jgi:hypothetical protein
MELGDRRLCHLKAVEYTTAATKKAAREKSLTLMMLSPPASATKWPQSAHTGEAAPKGRRLRFWRAMPGTKNAMGSVP